MESELVKLFMEQGAVGAIVVGVLLTGFHVVKRMIKLLDDLIEIMPDLKSLIKNSSEHVDCQQRCYNTVTEIKKNIDMLADCKK